MPRLALSARYAIAVVAIAIAIAYALIWHARDRIDTDAELLEAIRRGEIESVEAYLLRGGSATATIDVYGEQMTLLKAAIVDREEDVALALMNAGATLESSGVDIMDAATNGLTRVLERVLPISREQEVVETGLANAADNGYYDVIEVYLQRADGRQREWAAEYGRAATSAMFAGYDDAATLLIEAGAEAPDLVHAAARFSSPGMIRYLLSLGMSSDEAIDFPGVQDRRPIEFAWTRYREEKAYLESRAQNGQSAALSHDAEYVLFELLRAGARLNDVDLWAIVKDGVAEVDAVDGNDAKLVAAARIGLADRVQTILTESPQFGADVMRSAVITALENDHDDIARILLRAGSPLNGGVLHVASLTSSPGMVRYLVSRGAAPSERLDGKTVLEWWLEGQNRSTYDPEFILHELIVAGADACSLMDDRAKLPGLSVMVLRHSAPDCWDGLE